MKSGKFLNRDIVKAAIFFLGIFIVSFFILYLMHFVPDELQVQDITTVPADTASTTTIDNKQYELPVKITIDKIGVDAIVQNPDTTNVLALDDLLLKGAVRYPGSGLPGQGNMFFFGHSTGLPIVHNQAFKTFNNLKNLVAGDTILVYSEKHVFTYKVNNVKMVKSSDDWVDFSVKKNMLTLSTCNTFAQKDDRYVVEADYVGSTVL